tara:strand:- start:18 stop:401 length:384 start_codon:yes stop_codon:yes gene_type:complete
MAYPPFKMRGHELPGPNQRTPLPNRQDAVDIYSTDGNNYQLTQDQMAEQGFKPLEEYDQKFQNMIKDSSIYKEALANKQKNANEQPNNQLSNDMASTESVNSGATGVQGPDAKKKVDVEVTVNGQKV